MKIKKIAKIFGFILLFCIGLLAAVPYLFEDKIIDLIKKSINNNVNATVDFTDADISLLSNFPKASITLKDVAVINHAPFKGDSLFYGKEVAIQTEIGQLFNGPDESIKIDAFSIDDAIVNIKVNTDGKANYDIAKTDEVSTKNVPENVSKTSDFSFNIEQYEVNNMNFRYHDATSHTTVKLSDFNHKGSGDFSLNTSELDTETSTKISFGIDDTMYIDNQQLSLDAVLGLDLENNTYSFLENEALINKLPLTFNGYVTVNEANQEVHITFSTPSSDFKNFLAVIPETYAKSAKDVQTSGDFKIEGAIDGIIDDTTIPQLDIKMSSTNASFKYPELPKSVENIHLNAQIKNTTGKTEDTFVNIDRLAFKIDEDSFSGNGNISNLTTNPKVNASIKGRLDLANISKAYPITLENELQGILDANLTTSFDMNAIETNNYERIKNAGDLKVADFVFSSEDIVNPINIAEATIAFKPKTITLQKFDATTGKSDLSATGTLHNLLGFLFSNQKLKGNFNVQADSFYINDFMVASNEGAAQQSKTVSEGENLKIPAFLDCSINAKAKTVYYDNMELKNVTGDLTLANEKAVLKNVSSDVFNGNVTMSGEVSTQQETPTFAMKLDMDSFDVSQSFEGLDLFQGLAPIAKALQGKINTNIELSGNLTKDFTPDLNATSGNILAQLLTATFKKGNTELFNTLNDKISFFDLNKLNLNDLKTQLSFEDGKVKVKPFQLQYEDIGITLEGSHGFDKTIDYNATFQVPAKYLGNEITTLLSQLKSEEAKNISIPITANIKGSATKPKITTDLASATTNLAKQLAILKAKEAVGDTKGEAVDAVLDILTGNTPKKDSTETNTSSGGIQDIVGGLFGKKKKKKDSTQN